MKYFVKYKLKHIYNLCSYKIEIEEFDNWYISINIKDIDSFNDFENKINDLLLCLIVHFLFVVLFLFIKFIIKK